MKKLLLFICLLFLYSTSTAQLDREHWFAPLVDGQTNFSPFQTLYLSTNRTTPFVVNIYNNNIIIASVNLSKGNPQKVDIPRQMIITRDATDLFTPITKGLYVEGEYAFFANLRFSVINHAEIITSKGTASLGTEFRAAVAPITTNDLTYLNFMTSILATEDQTTVTVSDYQNSVIFSNGVTALTSPTLTFTLNKGQSYIIEGKGNIVGNSTGFIGAKITSNKPINVTNGNFNGQYAGPFNDASDILMDQSVPVSRLGQEFALVKGNGDPINGNMEGALIIATENNTQIFANNEIAPVATLNAGQHFVVPGNKYVLQGNGHYNLYLRSSKNIYVYQLLAGINQSSGVQEHATGGFNFIPPLTCYLPKQIDEIGLINENFVITSNTPGGLLNIPTKLNLITEAGATVFVNGTPPLAIYGPYPMTGTSNWVTYGIPNTTGNITINSNKAITAGITAGMDAVGYGGFFAGFYTLPIIVKTGDCIPGISLTVDPNNYDTYQWYVNGTPIVGATSATYNPTTPGYYTCEVGMGTCTPLTTPPFKVTNCTRLSQITYDICGTKIIQPTFSNSNQTVNIASINIVTQPTVGTVTINPTTGAITYTTNQQNGTDTFTYNFCGNNQDFPDCETVTVTINIANPIIQNAVLNSCFVNGSASFNLTTADITTSSNPTITYYPTLVAAQNENAALVINNPTAYATTTNSTIYAVVANTIGCKKIAEIQLNIYPYAIIAPYNGIFCDDNFDGNIDITLSNLTTSILNNPAYFTNVRYYGNLADANAGNTNILGNNFSTTTNTTIYVRVESPDGCPPLIQAIPIQFGTKIPLNRGVSQQVVCDDDFDGIKNINLSTFTNTFTNDPAVTANFYTTLADAQAGGTPISSNINATGNLTFYIRFEKAGFCSEIGTLHLEIRAAKKSEILQDQNICIGRETTLDAGPGFDTYLWNTGATTSSITATAGNYWVDLTNNGCTYRQHVTVSTYDLPVISSIEITSNIVTVIVSGGQPPYSYSLDGSNWQNSNIFSHVPKGPNKVYVRDSNNCQIIEKEFFILNLINTITPNGDGVNETISYPELVYKENVVFKIFDRYGAQLFEGTPQNNYTWEGNLGKRPVPTDTYWYILQWSEPNTTTIYKYSSWLLVQHRNDQYSPRK